MKRPKKNALLNVCSPQFDNSAVAVIITRSENVKKYEKMVSGEELLESW